MWPLLHTVTDFVQTLPHLHQVQPGVGISCSLSHFGPAVYMKLTICVLHFISPGGAQFKNEMQLRAEVSSSSAEGFHPTLQPYSTGSRLAL